MNLNLCSNCGSQFVYRNGSWICQGCGARKPEEITNEEVSLLYAAFQKLRLAEFEEAERAFDDIIRRYPKNPNGYWGRLMSKYDIKYEEDFDGKKIPTCYASSIERITADNDYKQVLACSDADGRAFYERQAEYIERVRREWIEKAQREKPYDIFICYKDSDEENSVERTRDSIEAQALYTHFTELGYHVFYSHESLRDKVGEKYEPYIFNALSTAKVMLVYGTKPEYITSTWLKNEWTRYQKRIKAGEKKPDSLLVACDGFSPNALPHALSAVQCFNAEEKTFYGDLEKTVYRLVHGEPKADHAVSGDSKAKTKAPLFISLFLVLAALGGFLAWRFLGNATVTTVSNLSQNVTIISNGGTFPKDTEFRVEEITDDEKLVSMAQTLSVDQETYRLYDMELWCDGSEYDAIGNVTVAMPLPAEISAENAVVYYMSGSTPRKISSQVDDGKISFVTNHFSVYMIAEALTDCAHVAVTDSAVPATCTENGLTEGSHCSLCGEVLVEQTVILAAHKPGPAADCTNAQYCTVCRIQLSPELGHIPGTAATCTTVQTCSVCRAELAPAGHTPGEEATCTTEQACTTCGKTLKSALGHKPGGSATCTEPSNCMVCGQLVESAGGHMPGAEATCTKAQTCLVCEEELAPKLGHNYVRTPNALLGYTKYTCSHCGDTYIEYGEDHVHEYQAEYTEEPTCDTDGYTTYTCIYCNDSYDDDYVDAIGHSYDNGEVTEPTCEDDGYTTYTCTVCYDTYDDHFVDALGHSYDEGVVTEPTCTEEGYTTYTCDECYDSYDADFVDAIEHIYDGGEVTEPTCEEDGYTTYTCIYCDITYDDDYVDATGHTYDSGEVTEPTCEEDGYTTYTCIHCGDSYDDDFIDATGHMFDHDQGTTCTVCGEEIDSAYCE